MFHSMNVLRLFQVEVDTCRNWIEQVETHYKCVRFAASHCGPLLPQAEECRDTRCHCRAGLRESPLACPLPRRPESILAPFSLTYPVAVPKPLLSSLSLAPLNPTASRDNPFHNFRHAFTVLHKVWMFLFKSTLRVNLQDVDVFALLFAAVCHDLEHPGTTNNFQVNSMTDLALIHNDQSVLENHHCSVAFRIAILPGCEMMNGLEKEEQKEFRRLVIGAILGTDMTHHKAILGRLKQKLDEKTGALSETSYNINDLEDRVVLVRRPAAVSRSSAHRSMRTWAGIDSSAHRGMPLRGSPREFPQFNPGSSPWLSDPPARPSYSLPRPHTSSTLRT